MSFSYFLARVGGARIDILRKLPGSVAQQAAMGAVILTTAVFAAASAAYALSVVHFASIWWCVLAGLLWGLAILNLDRLLVLGLANESGLKRNLGLAAPRVVLALIIGVVISTPLMLKIFEPEINAQMMKNNIAALEQSIAPLNTGPLQEKLTEREREMRRLQDMIAAGPTADARFLPEVQDIDKQMATKQQEIDKAKADYDKAQAEYIAESDGTGGTGVVGCADECVRKQQVADERRAIWQQKQSELQALKDQRATYATTNRATLLAASAKAIEDAKRDLPQVTKTVDSLRDAVSYAQNGTINSLQENTGIIARLKALSDVTAGNFLALMARIAVALLFIAIELLPVLFKVMQNLGKRTPYQQVSETFDEHEVARAQADASAQTAMADSEREAEVQSHAHELRGRLQWIDSAHVTSAAPGHTGPGHRGPGHSRPGDTVPLHRLPNQVE
ncbi:DUF4407 domain-containing protein [Smaragdicoccus niigatensis]|uniref:DUF4407 domain-containing protein n=1 Tax=Smaragdicoccus niigatensis TaxID=359359 RepID=UPI000371AEEA|nr:DUF4407 domain-containing protein [Smaragdicoccus niigatensis]